MQEIAQRLGRDRCVQVILPHKDANDCLQAGIERDVIHSCLRKATSIQYEGLGTTEHYHQKVIEHFYPSPDIQQGYKTPWDKVNKDIIFKPSQLSIWTGINGHGKSNMLNMVVLDCVMQGAIACIASFEMPPEETLANMYRQAAAMECPSEQYLKKICDELYEKIWIYDHFGTVKVDTLLDAFRYSQQKHGTDVFVIDSFLFLNIRRS